jgi:hypothetical protein
MLSLPLLGIDCLFFPLSGGPGLLSLPSPTLTPFPSDPNNSPFPCRAQTLLNTTQLKRKIISFKIVHALKDLMYLSQNNVHNIFLQWFICVKHIFVNGISTETVCKPLFHDLIKNNMSTISTIRKAGTPRKGRNVKTHVLSFVQCSIVFFELKKTYK